MNTLTGTPARTRPVVVEAMQVRPDTLDQVAAWCGGRLWPVGHPWFIRMTERTTAGLAVNAMAGDWIIRTPTGFHQLDPQTWALLFTTDNDQGEPRR